MSASLAPGLQQRVDDAAALLRHIAARHAPAVLASSFGAEDMVLIDLVSQHRLRVGVFTLDTGRLPEETHALIERARERYAIDIATYVPDTDALEEYLREHGGNAIYRSLALRQQCCALRKTAPLARALAGQGAWITGLRRGQSTTRADIATESFDSVHGLPKFNPLADWNDDDVLAYLDAFDVPVNALHARGYPSIGCAPCTRAVQPGEDSRAGRWWWEAPEHKECGLHRRSASPSVETVAQVDP
jgi:phosphoadenosine phosphosulfate reductase